MKVLKAFAVLILALFGWALMFTVYLGLVSLIRWGFA